MAEARARDAAGVRAKANLAATKADMHGRGNEKSRARSEPRPRRRSKGSYSKVGSAPLVVAP